MKSNIILFVITFFFFSYAINSFSQAIPPKPMWIATFKSIPTGATKTFSGTADEVSQFKKIVKETTIEMKNHQIAIELTFPSTNVVITDTLPYAKAKHFFNDHSLVLNDCDNYIYYYSHGSFSNSLWRIKNAVQSEVDEKTPHMEGKGSFYMAGTSMNSNSKFVCSLTRSIGKGNFLANTPPDNTWISFYIKGDSDTNTIFRLGVWQKEVGSSLYNYFYTDIPLNFTGWKYMAIPYSELKLMKIDERIYNEEKKCSAISAIKYSLFSKEPDAKASVHLDYLTLLFSKTK